MSTPEPELTPADKALLDAEVYLAMKRPAEARQAALDALAGQPSDPRLLTVVAATYLEDEPAKAVDFAEQAIVADPEREYAHRLRALGLLGTHRPKDAVKSALASVRLAPARAEPLAVLARALAESGDVRGAVAAAGRAVQAEPTSTAGWFAQGTIALRGHQWPVAEDNFRKVLELDPSDASALNNLGVALKAQGKQPEALDLFARSAVAEPTSATARFNAERTRSQLGPSLLAGSGIRLLFVALLVANAAAWIGGTAGIAVLVVAVLGGAMWWSRRRAAAPAVAPHLQDFVDDRPRGWWALPPELRGSLVVGGSALAALFLLAALDSLF